MATRPTEYGPADRQSLRARLIAATPRWYRPWVHLTLTTGVGAVVLALGVAFIEALRPLELSTIPVVFLLANAFEWAAHRQILHRHFWPFFVLYERHTPEHHRIYHYDDMAIRSTREFRLVLIPAAGVAGIVLVTSPLAYLVGLCITANTGWLVLVTAGLYIVGYEISHLSYHLPPESFIGRLRLVRILREHHARHHHPRLMQRWNFNVTIPLFDWIRGTIVTQAQLEEAMRQDEGRP